jgi:hypothetical protein
MNYRLTLQRYYLFLEKVLDFGDKILGQKCRKCHNNPNFTIFNSFRGYLPKNCEGVMPVSFLKKRLK